MSNTLLASLTLRLSSHPENIATEALLHVLRVHHSSGPALSALLANAGLPRLESLAFKTQAYGLEGSIPDLVGCDGSGQEVLLLEAKFWAHLTDNQPNTYLSRLATSQPSILLFVCPEARRAVLWGALRERTKEAGHELTTISSSDYVMAASIDSCRHLAIVSWRAILDYLIADAVSHGDRLYQSDVEQLHGLCERMDSEAFLPIRIGELSQEIGRRVVQFAHLVDEAVSLLVRVNPDVSTKGLTTGGAHSAYGRYFRYRGRIGAFLYFSPDLWAKTGASPIWLQLKDCSSGKWETLPRIMDAMRTHTFDSQFRLIDNEGAPVLALNLPCGVEKEEVVREIARQTVAALEAAGP